MSPCDKHLQILIQQVAVCCWEHWFVINEKHKEEKEEEKARREPFVPSDVHHLQVMDFLILKNMKSLPVFIS